MKKDVIRMYFWSVLIDMLEFLTRILTKIARIFDQPIIKAYGNFNMYFEKLEESNSKYNEKLLNKFYERQ